MLIDDDPRHMQRVCLAQRFDNHLPGVQLVGLIHLLRAKRPGARDIAEKVVRMGGAERRDRQPACARAVACVEWVCTTPPRHG